jgi:hypothetical protein
VLVRPKHTGIREFRTIPVRMFYPAYGHFTGAAQTYALMLNQGTDSCGECRAVRGLAQRRGGGLPAVGHHHQRDSLITTRWTLALGRSGAAAVATESLEVDRGRVPSCALSARRVLPARSGPPLSRQPGREYVSARRRGPFGLPPSAGACCSHCVAASDSGPTAQLLT